ncbi:hypothetical protein DFH06DRAFT_1120561 [Mycena polygramma]|nr:hypothetical protein DFH06DRAFT_1120561 [Mycena polygramma]
MQISLTLLWCIVRPSRCMQGRWTTRIPEVNWSKSEKIREGDESQMERQDAREFRSREIAAFPATMEMDGSTVQIAGSWRAFRAEPRSILGRFLNHIQLNTEDQSRPCCVRIPEVPGIGKIVEFRILRREASPGQFYLSSMQSNPRSSQQSSWTIQRVKSQVQDLRTISWPVVIFSPQAMDRTVPVAQCTGTTVVPRTKCRKRRPSGTEQQNERAGGEIGAKGVCCDKDEQGKPAAPGNGMSRSQARAGSKRNPDNAETSAMYPNAASGMSQLDSRRTGRGFPPGGQVQKLQFNFIRTMPTVRGGVQVRDTVIMSEFQHGGGHTEGVR